MTIVRLFNVIFIFLLCPVQGMDLSIKVVPQTEKISSDVYRQRLKEKQQAQEELWKDVQEALGAEEYIVALVDRQISENLDLLKGKLPATFIKELQEIRKFVCHPEQLFEYKIQDKLLYNTMFFEINDLLKQRGLESATQVIGKIHKFTQKWDAITDSIDAIRLANNHIIWYQDTWNQLIDT